MTASTLVQPNTDVPVELTVRLAQFYARQVHAVNAGDFDSYRESFDPDAVFSADGMAAPLRGAAAIAAHSRRLAGPRAAAGATQRHHVTMTGAWQGPGDALTARSTTVIIATAAGGKPKIIASTECEDVLDLTGDRLRIRQRRVRRDGHQLSGDFARLGSY
jgi:ketosteroid isomerase-like protein